MCLLQDDIVKFVSEPASPPRLVEIPEEGIGRANERREVGEGDDTVVIEYKSDEDDEETLQEQFQLRSRFRRPGLPNVPLRATWCASGWPRSSRSLRPHPKR
jgi:hypothetical protein